MGFLANLQIGWFNGWIYSTIFMIVSCSNLAFTKRMTAFSWMRRDQVLLAGSADVVATGLCIFAIWKPIAYPGVLFWVGNVIYVLGLIVVALSIVAFVKTPGDRPVTRGVYKILRHPYYMGSYLSLIAIGLICKEWLILIAAIASMIPGFWSAKWEEEYCEQAYGDEYVAYKKTTGAFLPRFSRDK